jgi:hypothetical protein
METIFDPYIVHGPEKHGLSYTGPFIKKHFFSIFLTFL